MKTKPGPGKEKKKIAEKTCQNTQHESGEQCKESRISKSNSIKRYFKEKEEWFQLEGQQTQIVSSACSATAAPKCRRPEFAFCMLSCIARVTSNDITSNEGRRKVCGKCSSLPSNMSVMLGMVRLAHPGEVLSEGRGAVGRACSCGGNVPCGEVVVGGGVGEHRLHVRDLARVHDEMSALRSGVAEHELHARPRPCYRDSPG